MPIRGSAAGSANGGHGVLQLLDRFVGIVVYRDAGRLDQELHVAGCALDLVPVGLGRGARIDDEEDDSAHLVERCWLTQDIQRLEALQRLERGAHAEVICQAAVHEMYVRSVDAVLERLQVLACLEDTSGRTRRGPGIAEPLGPRRRSELALAAIVVERHRRERERYGRRCSGGACERHRVQVRAEIVESALHEAQTSSGRDVGGAYENQRSAAAIEVGEGRAVKQDFFVELRRQFGAAPILGRQRCPVARVQRARAISSPWTSRFRKPAS